MRPHLGTTMPVLASGTTALELAVGRGQFADARVLIAFCHRGILSGEAAVHKAALRALRLALRCGGSGSLRLVYKMLRILPALSAEEGNALRCKATVC